MDLENAVRYGYYAVNFFPIPYDRIWSVIYVLLLSSQCLGYYRDELDRAMTALNSS